AKPALTVAAESARGIKQVGTVDPHDASLDARGGLQCHVDTLTPDAGSESIRSVVGQLHRLPWRSERHGRKHGSEDFLLGDHRGRMYVGEECWPVVQATRRQGHLGLPAGSALCYTLRDESLDAGKLDRRNDRPDIRRLVQRRADTQP